MKTKVSLRAPRWTEADNERIRDFVKRRVPILRAAAALGRPTTSVRNQARKIGCPFPTVTQARKKFANDPQSSWRFH
jgi:hypothetical protein